MERGGGAGGVLDKEQTTAIVGRLEGESAGVRERKRERASKRVFFFLETEMEVYFLRCSL